MKHKKIQNILVPGIPLLAAGIFFFWMAFKAPPEKAETMRHSGETRATPRTAAKRDEASGTGSADIRFDVRAVSKMQPNPESGYELRCEKRDLSTSIPDLFRGDSSSLPESLDFPLFDGRFVQLKALRHQSMGTDQGVVFAKVDGEVEGGHALLSYVGTALAGMIHLPSRRECYEIRTAPDGRSHILTQINPDKMGTCGGCAQHVTK